MGHQSVVSLLAVAFLILALAGAPVLVVAEESQKERGLEAVKPDTIMRIGEQGADKKGLPIEVFVPPPIRSIANAVISPDDHYLATTDGSELVLWNVKTGQQVRSFPAPWKPGGESEGLGFYSLLYDSASRHIFWGWGSYNLTQSDFWEKEKSEPFISIATYQIDEDKQLAAYRAALGEVGPLSLSTDSQYLFNGYYGILATWDIQAGRIVKIIRCEGQTVAFSPDQRYGLCVPSYRQRVDLYTPSDNSLRLIDLISGKELKRFIGHTRPITAAGFSRGGSIVFSTSHDGTLRIWDTATGNSVQVLKITDKIIRYYPDNPSAKPSVFGIDDAVVSPDGQYVVAKYTTDAEENKATAIWEISTGLKIRQFDDIHPPFRFFRDGRHFYAVKQYDSTSDYDRNNQNGAIILTRNGTLIQSFQKVPWSYINAILGFTENRRNVLYSTEKGTLVFDFDTATITKILPVGAQFLSGDGKHLFLLSGTGNQNRTFNLWSSEIEVKIYNIATVVLERELLIQSGRTTRVEHKGKYVDEPVEIKVASVSQDGSYFVTVSSDGILSLWDTRSGQETQFYHSEWQRKSTWEGWEGLMTGSLSPDGSRLVSVENSNNYTEVARIWNPHTGREITAIRLKGCCHAGSIPTFSADGSRFTIFSGGSNDVEKEKSFISVCSLDKNEFSIQLDLLYPGIETIHWSADSKTIILVGRDFIVHIDAINNRIQNNFAISEGYGDYKSAISSDGKYVANPAGIWDAATGKPLVALAVFADGDDWLAITPEGYYSSSEKGHQYVNMRRGSAIYTADQLYDAFYRPDLVIDKLRGQDIQQAGGTTIEEALSNPPPSAEIVATTIQKPQGITEVKYRIQGQGGGIGDVRLFHNQKLVRTVRVDAPSKDVHEGTAAIQAVAGENEVGVIAFNRQNSVQGITQTALFQFDAPAKDPDLYIVGIGIGQYRLKDVNLPLAAKDVMDITKALSARMKSLYQPPKVHVELLVDGITEGGVTRERILNRLRELAGKLQPDDQLVIFVASHGLLWNGQYYVVTYDYDGSFGPEKGISASEIMDASRDIKALNQLFIFDTCHAGGVDQTLKAIYDARIRLFARRMGLHVYASASPLQEAIEGYQGRGLFAYALLEGLRRPKEVDQDGDGLVATTELGRYAKQKTEQVGQEIGFHQTPLIINVGQDKAIYRYSREASPTVALANPPADSGNRGAAPTTRAIELPTIRVGDRYTYESETLDRGQAAYQTLREVTAMDGDRVTVAVTPVKGGATRQTYYDRAWNFLGSGATPQEGISFTPALKYLDFPLVVGKRWNATSIELNTKTQRQREFKVSGSVEGWERVDVPAGSFEAFKIVLKTEIVDGANRTFSTDVSWYAPSIRRTVKSELTGQEASSGTEEQKVVRLVSYQLR